MQKLTLGDAETKSADVTGENIEALRALYPETFVEGKIDFDVLRQLLGGGLDDREEKYGLNWHGKRQARQLALTPSTGTLRPAPGESVDWETTQNLMIEGDNLEVLKLLQKSYAGKVKLIYIDPPYNTGKDFVYPDDFRDNIANYLELTGQVQSGKQITSNPETSGRYHTDWLNMMYPRLRLARGLLSEDGVIFISIDDHEVKSLRALCDEIFGIENFVATVIWQKVYAPKSSARHFSEDHDYIVVYAKNGDVWRPRALPRTEDQNDDYKNPDDDPRGPWKANNLSARNYYSKGLYAIRCPGGRLVEGPPKGRYWSISEEKLWQLQAKGRVWWGKDGNNVPAPKIYMSEVMDGRVPQTLWVYKDVGHNQESKKEFLKLLPIENADAVFDTPKPRRLVRRMLDIATSVHGHDVVLDFFSGSGTTGDAVMAQNGEDGGNRRYVCVQLPWKLETPALLAGGLVIDTLSGITKERLRRAAKKIKAESPLFAGDLGFRVFKLDSSNIRPWEPNRDDLEQTLLESEEHIKSGRTEQDILYELLLKLGLELTVPIEAKTIAGKTVHCIGGGVLLVCLAESIASSDVETLAEGIVAWRDALKPARESQLVFRDSAFADDVAKTNLTAILQQQGLGNVKSV